MPFFALLSISSLFFASCKQEKTGRSAGISYDETITDVQDFSKPQTGGIGRDPQKKTNAERKNELLADFEKPLQTYPQIRSSMAVYGDDGLLYRKGIDTPFSGRLIDLSREGVALLEVSFLEGQPHGLQARRNEDGSLAMEAIFDHGVLTGIKTRWWPSGLVKEEEYWDDGTYKGRCMWDESGRMVKEERVR
ncbi:MAG: hypothetical protein VW576_03250 [Opitutae bacterium]